MGATWGATTGNTQQHERQQQEINSNMSGNMGAATGNNWKHLEYGRWLNHFDKENGRTDRRLNHVPYSDPNMETQELNPAD